MGDADLWGYRDGGAVRDAITRHRRTGFAGNTGTSFLATNGISREQGNIIRRWTLKHFALSAGYVAPQQRYKQNVHRKVNVNG
jgi:hypothetical protein